MGEVDTLHNPSCMLTPDPLAARVTRSRPLERPSVVLLWTEKFPSWAGRPSRVKATGPLSSASANAGRCSGTSSSAAAAATAAARTELRLSIMPSMARAS